MQFLETLLLQVFETREELQQEAQRSTPLSETVCITSGEYEGLISAVLALAIILIILLLAFGLAYRRYWTIMKKNRVADRAPSHASTSYPATTRASAASGMSSLFGFQRSFPGFSRARPNFPDNDTDCLDPTPGGTFEDPSEPIYTDPSLFERSRSLRSISVSDKGRLTGMRH